MHGNKERLLQANNPSHVLSGIEMNPFLPRDSRKVICEEDKMPGAVHDSVRVSMCICAYLVVCAHVYGGQRTT